MYDDLVTPLRAVCVLDPAIDRIATAVERYAETRDPSLVVELPGRYALWCTLEPLSVPDFAAVDGAPTPSAKLLQAFRLSVRAIENFAGPGLALRPTLPRRMQGGAESTMWSDDELASVQRRVGMKFIYEIGALAYERAIEGNGWGGGVTYTLPQSSVQGLEQIARLLAAHERKSASIRSSERSAKPPPETKNSKSSDAATDANAPSGAADPAASP